MKLTDLTPAEQDTYRMLREEGDTHSEAMETIQFERAIDSVVRAFERKAQFKAE